MQRAAAASIAAWTDVIAASGTAGSDEIAAAGERARARFTPDLPSPDGSSAR